MVTEQEIRKKYEELAPLMDERMRRHWTGIVADVLGAGGITLVSRATGMSRTTIRAGRDELRAAARAVDIVRVRRAGGGRPRLEKTDPNLVATLESIIEPATRGDPESPLRWTSRSTRKLAKAMQDQGKPISPQKIGQLLFALGYRVHATPKMFEGTEHPECGEQFEFINDRVEVYQARSAPVISVDMKKQQFIRDIKGSGPGLQATGEFTPVRVPDFNDPDLDKSLPDFYSLGRKEGWVNVSLDHDASEFTVESIARWWSQIGRKIYEHATELLIITDAGGGSGYRSRPFKTELQRFANRTGLTIGVSHFPPGSSKWSKVEHHLCCHFIEHWRGHPLVDHQTAVQLIGATRTTAGVRTKVKLDHRLHSTEIKGTDAELQDVNLLREDFYGDWNYTISAIASARHQQL